MKSRLDYKRTDCGFDNTADYITSQAAALPLLSQDIPLLAKLVHAALKRRSAEKCPSDLYCGDDDAWCEMQIADMDQCVRLLESLSNINEMVERRYKRIARIDIAKIKLYKEN
jgi:hypothetical protein